MNTSFSSGCGLYVHIPFCAQKCRYCDFASYVGRENAIDAYLESLFREMNEAAATRQTYCRSIAEQCTIGGDAVVDSHHYKTVYIGGGTPSVLPCGAVALIMANVRKNFAVDDDAEITIEANPNSLTAKKLDEYLDSGINRVSLGVQSLSDELLQTLGRAHTASDARAAMRLLKESGVSWSADAMLSLPGQSLLDVETTISEIIGYDPGHISAYSLILEEGTPLSAAVSGGKLKPLDEDAAYALETRAAALLEETGYARYEISSFAKPGRQSRHNLNYWNNGAYVGLGAAAHGAFRAKDGVWTRTENAASLAEYIGGAKAVHTRVSREDEMFETVMLAMRKLEGLSLSAFAARFSERFEVRYAALIAQLVDEGLLNMKDGFAALTTRGLEMQNLVLVRFLE